MIYQEIDRRFAKKDHAGALQMAEFGLAQNPADFNLYRVIGRIYQSSRMPKTAIRWFDAAIKLGPPSYQIYMDRSAARNDLPDYPGVIEDLNIAELMNKNDFQLYLRRGGAHWEMRDWASASRDFKRAAELSPENADVAWVNGLLSLQMGDFRGGWPGYDARWRSARFKSNRLVTQKPQWSPGLRRVLVWGEQGIGDQVFYSSMLTHLRSMTDKVTMMVDPRLISIMSRSIPDVDFVPNTSEVDVDEHDSHLPIASIGSRFVNSLDDIPRVASRGYLKADPEKVALVRSKITANKPLVALSWTSAALKIGPQKSISIEDLKPLLDLGCQFVDSQYIQSSTEPRDPRVLHTGINCRDDFEMLAALLEVCSIFVGVSSSTAHMAAALGRPVLLMDANKLWYWGNRDENNISYWYPSVKVFPRDSVLAPWNNVVEAVKQELVGRLNGH
jgi:hypothetical protein